jgi:hypothetical protein
VHTGSCCELGQASCISVLDGQRKKEVKEKREGGVPLKLKIVIIITSMVTSMRA